MPSPQMRRSTLQVLVALCFIALASGLIVFDNWRKQSKAEDILGFQGVTVCSSKRDFSGDRHRCPSKEKFITRCSEAQVAIADVNRRLPADAITSNGCQLRTLNEREGLYAFVITAQYPLSSPTSPSETRTRILGALYDTYTNLYLPFDSSSTELGENRSFRFAFLVRGEPGFRMQVVLQDENGVSRPGAGTLIRVSCGSAQDIMQAEPDGTSWFSFAGYEKLRCGSRPLVAEVIVQRDRSGLWAKNTPTYSYLYDPVISPTMEVQNRPEPPQLTFNGNWQGIGVLVQINSSTLEGTARSKPLAGVSIRFSCSANLSIFREPSIERASNARGRASIGLADAQQVFPGCPEDKFQTTMADYDARTGASSKDNPAYDFYFASPGPISAGRISGPTLTDGLIEGAEMQIGGRIMLADIKTVPGGYLSAGSQLCLFYSLDVARASTGCPAATTDTVQVTQGSKTGSYIFGGSQANRISYGDYLKNGAGPVEVRIVTYKGAAYPPEVVQNNDTPLDLKALTLRDIRLPSAKQDLQDHVCLSVIQKWGSERECTPLFNIIEHESRWLVDAENSSSGAFGLFQSLPPEKYKQTALPEEDYHAAANQIRWGINYIEQRYGSPSQAWSFWQANHYY